MILGWLDRGALPIHPMNKPRTGQIRVACVGDSITYGYGVKGWRKNNYPAVLDSLLGDGCCVNNFGFSGSTASDTGDCPYTAQRVYRQSLDFLPELVILMLGTNDTKPQNWKSPAHYMGSLRGILRTYQTLPSAPRILLLSPPPAWSVDGKPVAFEIREDLLAHEVRTAVRLLAEEEGAIFIDTYDTFREHAQLFFDGVHPNAAGAKRLAETVYRFILTKGVLEHD